MGDRGEILIKDSVSDNGVYIYTHWYGSDCLAVIAKALDRGRDRWGDTSYLTRIIFCEFFINENGSVNPKLIMDKTGFGISDKPLDSEWDTPIIVCEESKVYLSEKEYSFEEFIVKFTDYDRNSELNDKDE